LGLRKLCDEHGSTLIWDEVMTGLRVHFGSAQARYEIVPDLCCLGKIVGGGSALSALIGKQEWMDKLAPLGPVYQAGTLSGNPIGTSAGLAMLRAISAEKPYERLEILGSKLEAFLAELAHGKKIPLRVERVGSMVSVYFRTRPVRNAADARDIDEKRFNQFFWLCIEQGLMLPPSPFEAWFLSTEHASVYESHIQPAFRRVFEAL
jgi:glutamate-1-semialdehyde 2,1-aminomutase